MAGDTLHRAFTLSRIRVDRRRLRLSEPLATAAATYRDRDVLLVHTIVSIDGRESAGLGEASSLPDYGGGTESDLAAVAERVERDLDVPSIVELDQVLPWLVRYPVLRFGVECAILDALARDARLPLYRMLGGAPGPGPASVPVQFTLGARDLAASLGALEAAAKAGYSHVKLKVGVDEPGAELDKIRRLAEACPSLVLRLDANGAWNLDTALDFLHTLPRDRVELVEQPVADEWMGRLLAAYDGRGPVVAADESCADRQRIRALIRTGRLGAVVVKPSVVGGLLPATELFALAGRHHVGVIVSNLMESAAGRSAVAHLAAAHPEFPGPHGLATGRWFAEDVDPEPDRIADGRLMLRSGNGIGLDTKPRPYR